MQTFSFFPFHPEMSVIAIASELYDNCFRSRNTFSVTFSAGKYLFVQVSLLCMLTKHKTYVRGMSRMTTGLTDHHQKQRKHGHSKD